MRNLKALRVLFAFLTLSLAFAGFSVNAEPAPEGSSRFEKDGLAFDFADKWELSDQSNAAAQQLVLTEKALDAQIMIVVLRRTLSSGKQEEEAKTALIEPGINRVLRQYEATNVKVALSPLEIELAGAPAEGTQLRFEVDGSAGTTEICWGVVGKRLVQMFFIRPDKTEPKTKVCWDMIRGSLRIEKPTKNKQ